MVLVQNNRPRLICLGLPGEKPIRLMPGVNSVPDDSWARAMEQEMVRVLLHDGQIEVAREGVRADNPLKDMSRADAVKLVQRTFDEKLLRAWQGVERRYPVLEAISAQLKQLAAAAPPRAKLAESGE